MADATKREALYDINSGMRNVGIFERISYAMGDLGCNMSWAMISAQLMFFWTNIVGLPAAACGTWMFVSKFWDAVNDPIIGSMADNTRTKWGRYRPWIIGALLPMLIANILCFVSFPSESVTVRLVYAVIMYMLVVLFYTAVNIPYSALPAAMTLDSDARGRIGSLRLFLAFGGSMLVSLLILPLINITGGGDMRKGYFGAAVIFSLMAIVPFLWCFFGTREVVNAPVEKHSIFEMSKVLKGNKYILAMVVIMMAHGLVFSSQFSVRMYYFTYNVGDQSLFSINMFFTNLGMMLGAITMTALVKYLNNKRLLGIFANGAILVTGFVCFFLKPVPASVSIVWLYHMLTLISGWGLGLSLTCTLTMTLDVTEYTQYKYGLRAASFINAFTTFTYKTGQALAGAIVGWTLGLAGYIGGSSAQSATSLSAINMLMHIVPAGAALIAIITYLTYNLDRNTYNKIVQALAGNKEAVKGLKV
jgi:GPH family glycoside/pentoside/hexuronide:cation symporter/probable glucitol transport protein GutA